MSHAVPYLQGLPDACAPPRRNLSLQGELQRVLFPVFVHCYLELVAPEKDVDREKARNASRTLLDRYSEVRR